MCTYTYITHINVGLLMFIQTPPKSRPIADFLRCRFVWKQQLTSAFQTKKKKYAKRLPFLTIGLT